ncbi:LuxR C-terminal-related transcriptional regulator [Vibrio tetraodonis]|uniref:LuxR C-terminal-related transcriptional regulator n=1 Tax=Vibrio tetraodonis TaxID=2231647 RepID=UPI000E0A54D5|nr:LuxR C-terminal-related transcriptional regulator [Vibrio tetraodonis]
MANQPTYEVTFLSDVSLQSRVFNDSLKKGIEHNVCMVTIEQLLESVSLGVKLGDYVLFDYHYLDESKLEQYNQARLASENNAREIIINCPRETSSEELFKWRNLVGVFYLDDDMSTLFNGLEKIFEGEMWLTRQVAQDHIEYFRSMITAKTSQAYANLTKREKQIMYLLGHGASNVQIADELVVTENTVKTHLHNIFKKINAKNRLQALLWANNNIALEERY